MKFKREGKRFERAGDRDNVGEVVNRISWDRLMDEAFRSHAEISDNEEVCGFQVDDRGLIYFVRRRS
jgi:hypothetical protein